MLSHRGLASLLGGGVYRFFASQWKAVLFSAAIAVILHHEHALRVLAKFSLIVVSSLASQGPVEAVKLMPGTPVVVVVSNSDFVTRYGEKSPLDRCTLTSDIGKVLAKSPRRLAIDFDLSPLVQASESERECQRKLDGLLDREAPRLVLLAPFPAATEDLLRVKHDWMQARCRSGLHFADGNVEQSLGMVTELAKGEGPEMRARMADQLHADFSTHICDAIASSNDPRQNSWLTKQGNNFEVHADTTPINFPLVIRLLVVLPISSDAFERTASLEHNPVLLGGDWGRDDSFLTSIGELPGVVIHAARLISLAHPVESLWPIVGLLSDIGIALCFALVIQRFWGGYVRARRLDLQFEKQDFPPSRPYQRTALSSAWMFVFVLTYSSLVLFFLFAAEYLFTARQIVIAPLLIAVSMLVDGFVSGPVEQINKLLDEERDKKCRTPVSLSSSIDHGSSVMLCRLVGACVAIAIFFVMGAIFRALVQGLAGWIFMGALLGLYLLLIFQGGKKFWRRLCALWRLGRWIGRCTLLKKVGESCCSFFQIAALPHVSKGWRKINKVGQWLARLRAVVFWLVLCRAGWVLLNGNP